MAWNANFQKAISCHVFDRIWKVRPFLNSENFNFFEYLKIWSQNKIKLAIYFCKLFCAKLTPAANTKTSQMIFQDPLLPFSFNFRKVKATFPIFVGMCYSVSNKLRITVGPPMRITHYFGSPYVCHENSGWVAILKIMEKSLSEWLYNVE